MADYKQENRENVRRVVDIEHQWIPMPDGTQLAARLWLPEGEPCPAILEYIPYRKRDMVRPRDERNHPYFASHGYACLRVDMRGSGDSQGVMPDMYDQNELDDARHVIEWIAAQPWCDGRVGMFGTSWGGTTSLQAAVNAPAPLKAVIANCATIDRFEDDIHWMGGCLLTDSIEWGATLPAILAAPPDSATVGDDWMETWQDRLRNITSPFENWDKMSTRGNYWRHGSVRFQTDRLSCPILSVGGWSDRYSNSVMRLTRARPDICKGIVGPWGHHYPDHGEPGPGISFQDVALEWWDHWLKSEDNGVAEWPGLRLWSREFDPPQNRLSERTGGWIALDDPAQAASEEFHLGRNGLSSLPSEEDILLTVPFDLRHGECAGDTGYFGRVGGLPLDQAADDARALCFDTDALENDVDLVGHAELSAFIDATPLPSQIVCRLCEVTPDGVSSLVTRTVLALELDKDLDGPRAAQADTPTRYRIQFPTTAYRFKSGNRIRLAIGASYWPLVWPNARPSTLRIQTNDAVLSLPKRPDQAQQQVTPFPNPKDLPERKGCEISVDGNLVRTGPIQSDGKVSMGWHQPQVTMKFTDIDLDFSYETVASYSIAADDPASAGCSMQHRFEIRRPDGTADILSRLNVSGSPMGRSWGHTLVVKWNDEVICDRTFQS